MMVFNVVDNNLISFQEKLDDTCLIDEFCILDGKDANLFLNTAIGIHQHIHNGSKNPLFVANLDHESLWEQINVVLNPSIRKIERNLSKIVKTVSLSAGAPSKQTDMAVKVAKVLKTTPAQDVTGSVEVSKFDEFSEQSVTDIEEDEGSREPDESVPDDKNVPTSAISDDEMDAWLDEIEELDAREERRIAKELQSKNLDNDGNDEEDDILVEVQKALYEDDDDDDDEILNENGPKVDYKYDEFFKGERGPQRKLIKEGPTEFDDTDKQNLDDESDYGIEDEAESDEEEEEVEEEEEEEEGEEEEEEGEGNHSAINKNGSGNVSTSKNAKPSKASLFERKAATLRAQIAGLEEHILADKPWELKGEVLAKDRPQDSLLELAVDVERASKPAPVVTQQHTSSLEDLICKRIKDGVFDDVLPPERKQKRPSEAPELSQEKSQQGLGELYAEEFLKKALNAQPEAADKQIETNRQLAEELFLAVSRELDSLSHFFFTPLPVSREESATITSLPLQSLELEDVTPVGESGAAAMAPHQVLAKKTGRAAALLSAEELSREDRQRLRRASKNQKRKENQKEKLEHRGDDSEAKLDQELKRDKRVQLNGQNSKGSNRRVGSKSKVHGGESLSKSATFFAQLQKESKDGTRYSKKRKTDSSDLLKPHGFKL